MLMPWSRAAYARLGATALALLVTLAACGDDGEGGARTPPATATSAPTHTFTVVPTATATVPPTATATPSATPTNTALPAAFNARGSVGQVYVTDAAPGQMLELIDAGGVLVATGTADDQGSLIFRGVPFVGLDPGTYFVATGSGAGRRASGPLTVTTETDHPDQSFYAGQTIGRGYGYLATRDGTKLAINVVLPGPITDGPYPTVVEYSGYDPANPNPGALNPSTLIASLLGYAAVGVNIRGTGCSGGAFDTFEPLQVTDGYDVIETIAAQPWVKGNRVGMVGISYPGISQLFVARSQPPHLAAIAPLSVVADIGLSIFYPGGILNDGFALEWAAARDAQAMPGGQGWDQQRIDAGDEVCRDNQRLRGQNVGFVQTVLANAYYDPVIYATRSPNEFVDRITVPVFLAGAWQDEQTGGHFATMLANFTGTDRRHFTLINGLHVDPLGPSIFFRWTEFLSFYVAQEIPRFPAAAALVLQVVVSDVFGTDDLPEIEPDRFGDAASFEEALARYEAEPPVRVLFENGAGGSPGAPFATFEQTFSAWPIPETEPAIWYFAADGRLDPVPPTDGGTDSYTYDSSRAQQTSFHGTTEESWQALAAWDWQPLPDGKAVAYVSDPLETDLVMAGSGSVDLWLMATAPDVDLQVTLTEVRPDGQERYIQNGWQRASRRKLDEAVSTVLRPVHTHRRADEAPLPAGEFAAVRVELYPFAHVFHAGSRIRITVEAPGGERAFWRFVALEADGAVVTIGRSAAMPSRVVLPVIPGLDPPDFVPPCPSLRGQPCRPYVPLSNTPG